MLQDFHSSPFRFLVWLLSSRRTPAAAVPLYSSSSCLSRLFTPSVPLVASPIPDTYEIEWIEGKFIGLKISTSWWWCCCSNRNVDTPKPTLHFPKLRLSISLSYRRFIENLCAPPLLGSFSLLRRGKMVDKRRTRICYYFFIVNIRQD